MKNNRNFNPGRFDFQEINSKALELCPGLLEQILPNGRLLVHEYTCGDIQGNEGQSFKFNIETGQWADFATDERGSDMISLLAAQKNISQLAAAKELAGMVGYSIPDNRPAQIMPVPNDIEPPAQINHWQYGRPDQIFTYKNERGQLLGYACRFNTGKIKDNGKQEKEFRPYVFTGNGWEWKGFNEPYPLYRLESMADMPNDAKIIITEGEAKSDILRQTIGDNYVVLAIYGGSGKAGKVDLSPLAEKSVLYWPDNDQPGFKAALAFTKTALSVAGSVHIIKPPADKPETWDAANAIIDDKWDKKQILDYLGANRLDREEFEQLAAKRYGIGNDKQQEIKAQEWNEPIGFDSVKPPQLSPEMLPKVLSDYCFALAEETQTPPELPCAIALAVTAVAAQGMYKIKVRGHYFETLNLYAICPMEPANRKTAVVAACLAPLKSWEKEKAANLQEKIKAASSERQTLERVIDGKRKNAARAKDYDKIAAIQVEINELESKLPEIPQKPRLLVDNVTPEAMAAFLANYGELGGLISAEGGVFDILSGMYSRGVPNIDLYLKAWCGESFIVDRRHSEPIVLNEPVLTLAICPQPVTLIERSASRIFRQRGFDGRFLYFMPTSLLGKRKLESNPVPESVKAAFHNKIHSLLPTALDSSQEKIPLKLSEGAYHEWLEFSGEIEKGLADNGEFYNMRDWAGKLAGTVARLAGLFHLVEHEKPEAIKVQAETMQRACTLGAFLSEHARAAYGLMGLDETNEAAMAVLQWIKRTHTDKFSTRDCHMALKGQAIFKHVKQVKAALHELAEREYIRPCETAQAGTGRKPGVNYEVNPAVFTSTKGH